MSTRAMMRTVTHPRVWVVMIPVADACYEVDGIYKSERAAREHLARVDDGRHAGTGLVEPWPVKPSYEHQPD